MTRNIVVCRRGLWVRAEAEPGALGTGENWRKLGADELAQLNRFDDDELCECVICRQEIYMA